MQAVLAHLHGRLRRAPVTKHASTHWVVSLQINDAVTPQPWLLAHDELLKLKRLQDKEDTQLFFAYHVDVRRCAKLELVLDWPDLPRGCVYVDNKTTETVTLYLIDERNGEFFDRMDCFVFESSGDVKGEEAERMTLAHRTRMDVASRLRVARQTHVTVLTWYHAYGAVLNEWYPHDGGTWYPLARVQGRFEATFHAPS
jgi:hypothetical protein